jgi:hypothetical protein
VGLMPPIISFLLYIIVERQGLNGLVLLIFWVLFELIFLFIAIVVAIVKKDYRYIKSYPGFCSSDRSVHYLSVLDLTYFGVLKYFAAGIRVQN